MASMYVANHLDVKAIVALTESGSTPLWMSRIRSGIPVYAFTRHVSTRRRVALYRGVYPISFDIVDAEPDVVFRGVCAKLLHYDLAKVGEKWRRKVARIPFLLVHRWTVSQNQWWMAQELWHPQWALV